MKKAIVIGGSSGIGRELAKILSADGYTVGVMGRRTALLKELQKEAGKNILIQKIDISRSDEAMPVLEKFIKKMEGVDLIVISSGTGYLNSSLEWNLENKTIMTNVTGFATGKSDSFRLEAS
jgi:short-subunit dehydrogenase